MEEPLQKSSSVSKCQVHFLQHLVKINQVRPVTAACALIVPGGAAPLREGQRLDSEILESLGQFSLGNNLLQIFCVENSLNSAGLLDAFEQYMQSDSSLSEQFSRFRCRSVVERFCQKVCSEPAITLLLTVLQSEFPRIFDQALFVSWFSLISLEEQTSEDEVFELFYAGLLHDIGLLFIEPGVVPFETRTTQDWHIYQQHPIAGSEMIEHLPGLPYATLRAVAEHHERLDGSGYPSARVAKQLNWRGQLIQLLDSCYAVYTRYFKPRGRTLTDIIPIIQMNAPTRADRAANSLIMALKEGTGTTACGVPDALVPELIQCVKERHNYIKSVLDLGMALNDSVGMVVSNARLFALQKTLEHIDIAMKQSGLINDAYMRWLVQVESQKLAHAYREVEDVFLMMQEVIYHIGRYKTQLFLCLDAPAAIKYKSQFEEVLSNLNALVEPGIPEKIAEVWEHQANR